MLVLSRMEGQRIIIGGEGREIVISVVEIHNGKVKIGVTCEKDIPVDREELWDRKYPRLVKETDECQPE